MFHRIGHLLLIVALLATVGGHWAVLQTVAWTNMLAANLQTDPLPVALAKTFDGKNPCCLCKQIAAGKKSEKQAEFPLVVKKIEFTHAPFHLVFTAPTDFWLQNEFLPHLSSLANPPPVPPPRGFCA